MKHLPSLIIALVLFTSVSFSQSLTIHISKAGTTNGLYNTNYDMYITKYSISNKNTSWEWIGRPNYGSNFIQGMVMDDNGSRGRATVTIRSNGSATITIAYSDIVFLFKGYQK